MSVFANRVLCNITVVFVCIYNTRIVSRRRRSDRLFGTVRTNKLEPRWFFIFCFFFFLAFGEQKGNIFHRRGVLARVYRVFLLLFFALTTLGFPSRAVYVAKSEIEMRIKPNTPKANRRDLTISRMLSHRILSYPADARVWVLLKSTRVLCTPEDFHEKHSSRTRRYLRKGFCFLKIYLAAPPQTRGPLFFFFDTIFEINISV